MATKKTFSVEFETLRANYPYFKTLPAHLKNYIDGLNKAVKPGQPVNTPCVLQVSQALNACGGEHKVPPRSQRRANPELPWKSGNYFLQAVDELEKHLTDKYGPGEEIKASGRTDMASMQKYLNGRQGLLCFRDGGYGFHTELWDRTRVLQDGAPSSNGSRMDQPTIWGKPRVVFWEAVGPTLTLLVPQWLPGWWEVKDNAETYYYHFFRTGVVHYTRHRPARLTPPLPTRESSGEFSAEGSQKVTVKWNVGELAVEVFTPAPTRPPVMAGAYPGHPTTPFTAKKMQ